jgi:hypothetical protein
MARREIALLENIDLAKLTIADLSSVKNGVLRQALFSALQSLVVDTAAEHTNHWKFTSHGKALLADLILPELPALGGSAQRSLTRQSQD